jgi:ABC-type multidrug transport system ATPase subunit
MIRVEGLRKRYGKLVAVDDLGFEVRAGETFALVGPNGAGKTTTLKLLLGLAVADAGRIAIGPDGLAPRDRRARERLGYVPQRVEFAPGRTVGDVLAFFADLRGLPQSAVARALVRVGLADLAQRRASELSGGYTQRLALAQALLGDPEILVLDEPTASLDPIATWEFRSLVEQLQKEGKTIVLCSHLLAEVERVAGRVLILIGGRRAALESLDELRARQASASRLIVHLTGAPAEAAAALTARGLSSTERDERSLVVDAVNGQGVHALETLRAAGIAVRSFEVARPTLEELFLQVAARRSDVP